MDGGGKIEPGTAKQKETPCLPRLGRASGEQSGKKCTKTARNPQNLFLRDFKV
jgi:hypothetical protein